MTWYTSTDKQELDYSKLIMATSSDRSSVYLLLPSTKDRSYDHRGYDWFNINTGEWNSCVNYKTVGEALAVGGYCNIRNCEVSIREV
ncbi:hypothetical protein NVP1187O_004 [Vibrio phage 1.187.O._10N.286.49.F1]|nr:hypothetical protein NVP1187O_004 [Vibrio phage 1.187.O._10N.286.49.F1]